MSFAWNTLLIVSLILNVVMVWYIREMIKRLWSVVSSKEPFAEEIESYLKHLKNVYEMEMFYGDETLQGLIEHTRYMADLLREYREVESFIGEENIAETNEEKE